MDMLPANKAMCMASEVSALRKSPGSLLRDGGPCLTSMIAHRARLLHSTHTHPEGRVQDRDPDNAQGGCLNISKNLYQVQACSKMIDINTRSESASPEAV